jgi:hypothetical protein
MATHPNAEQFSFAFVDAPRLRAEASPRPVAPQPERDPQPEFQPEASQPLDRLPIPPWYGRWPLVLSYGMGVDSTAVLVFRAPTPPSRWRIQRRGRSTSSEGDPAARPPFDAIDDPAPLRTTPCSQRWSSPTRCAEVTAAPRASRRWRLPRGGGPACGAHLPSPAAALDGVFIARHHSPERVEASLTPEWRSRPLDVPRDAHVLARPAAARRSSGRPRDRMGSRGLRPPEAREPGPCRGL